MIDPVRVKLDNGSQTTVSAEYAKSKGLTVLKDERAVDSAGRALPAKTADSVSGNVSRRRATKKTSARKRAAKKTADTSPAADQEESS